MENRHDICGPLDIKVLVDHFYQKVRLDDLLGPIFNNKLGGQWPEHLEKMNRFWNTVVLGDYSYLGNPFPVHQALPIHKTHFDRWLSLFVETINELFSGEKAEEAKLKASRMAAVFESKIRLSRQVQSK